MKDGFIKVAAAAPELRVADPKFNAEKIVECVEKAREEGVKLLAFPELAITGATCGHLYYQRYLLDAALEGLKRIAEATRGDDMLVVVGLPLRARGAVYSAAAVVSGGEVLGFTAEEAQVRFGFLMDAFKFGAPPHGGLAFGFDRLCSLFGGSESIRDYIAFPKNNAGRDVMLDAPGCIDQAQLDELCLSLVKPAAK